MLFIGNPHPLSAHLLSSIVLLTTEDQADSDHVAVDQTPAPFMNEQP
jgi:hypothetical protein